MKTINATDGRPQEPVLTLAMCQALRCLAIVAIMCHNFVHWLPGAAIENEYTYEAQKAVTWWQMTCTGGVDAWWQWISYLGHYGVPVFAFLSAYGLTLKYEAVRPRPAFVPFMRFHYLKMLRMMAVGLLLYWPVWFVGGHDMLHAFGYLGAQLLMVATLYPVPGAMVDPGPYWYFALMLQLYAVWRLLLCGRRWTWGVALAVGCTAVQMLCQSDGHMLAWLRYNCVGNMLPFVAGWLAARHLRCVRWPWLVAAVAFALTVLCQFYYYAWCLAPLAVCIGCVALAAALPARLTAWLAWGGGYAAALFVMHPVTRRLIYWWGFEGNALLGFTLYLLSTVALAWLCRKVWRRLPMPRLAS